MGVAKVGYSGERELNQHLPTAKSGSILRLCHRRYNHGFALADGMEWGVVGDRRGGIVLGRRHGQGTVCLSNFVCDFMGWVKQVGWGGSKPNRAARLRSGQEASVGAGPESHGRGVDGFVGVAVGGDIV